MESLDSLITAIVPAAGASKRLGLSQPKPLLELCGQTILEWTLAALRAVPDIGQIIITAPPSHVNEFERLVCNEDAVTIIPGGETRQKSVALALKWFRFQQLKSEYILVHDAARCLIETALIRNTISAVKEHGAVTAAVPMIDSVKEIDPAGNVVRSLARENLWAVQTPQVFETELLIKAHEQNTQTATDDASLVEVIHPVRVVEGDRENIKVTTPRDLILAREILAARLQA